MPNLSQHRNKADSNRTFLNSFTVDAAADWAAVVAFYTAVHLVEMLRAADNEHSDNHNARLGWIQRSHQAIHHEFRELWNASKLARYDGNRTFFARFTVDDVRDVLVGQYLAAVTAYVESRFAPPPAV